jgi:TolB protein
MKRLIWLAMVAAAALAVLAAQDINMRIINGQRPTIALPDLRGAGDAQKFMAAFNETLQGDIQGSGYFKIAPKTSYPLNIPQQPSDFVTPPPPAPPQRGRRNQIVRPPSGGGRWMIDWSGPPVNANYLAFGYTALDNGVFLLRGWLFDLSKDSPSTAQVIGKNYLASPDEAGARQTAHEFAADILALFGGKSLFGTHIYYVHQATSRSPDEIWVMDPDGSGQRQITHFNSITIEPSVSPDGSKIAFVSFVRGNPGIFVFSVDPVRDLRFYNQKASVNGQPSFTPDGKQIVFQSSARGCCGIYIANLDGSGFRPITMSRFIDAEPKVNPKTGTEIAFSSGRSGPEQIYRMGMDGGDIERLTDGTGEASNPNWHPDGQHLAFAWTRGFAAGKFNIFFMDVASRNYIQLTHDEGKNENPSWAPDGVHLAFMSNRTGQEQIWVMLANGTQAHQLTKQGINKSPAWGM